MLYLWLGWCQANHFKWMFKHPARDTCLDLTLHLHASADTNHVLPIQNVLLVERLPVFFSIGELQKDMFHLRFTFLFIHLKKKWNSVLLVWTSSYLFALGFGLFHIQCGSKTCEGSLTSFGNFSSLNLDTELKKPDCGTDSGAGSPEVLHTSIPASYQRKIRIICFISKSSGTHTRPGLYCPLLVGTHAFNDRVRASQGRSILTESSFVSLLIFFVIWLRWCSELCNCKGIVFKSK